MKKLYILDASGYLYRSYFALPQMTNPKGESTNALFGFIRSVMKLCKDFQPDYLVAVFDGPQNAAPRKEIYPEYKAHRAEGPQDFFYQIEWAKQFCDLMGIPQLCIPKVEADDTMATIAKWAENKAEKIYLCTSDKDLCQVVNNRINLLNTHKDNLEINPEKVEEIHGVPPEKMLDYLAIMGDSSDNIPGLPGFGPKTAAKLLNDFGSLDQILAHPEKVPGAKKQETIRQEKDKALLSRKLVMLNTNVDIPQEAEFFQRHPPDLEPLKAFYHDMNFSTFIKELDQMFGEDKQEEKEVCYTLVDEEKAFADLLTFLSKQKEICVDTETTSLKPIQAELVGVGFTVEPGQSWYVPVNGNLGLKRVLEGIKPLLENPNIGFYGHNIKYDLHVLENYGITIGNISFDTILASYLLNAHRRGHSLDLLCIDYFGKVKTPTSDLIGKGKKTITMRDVPIQTVSDYCCEDTDYTCRLKQLFEKELQERNLFHLLKELELPTLRVLAKMERNGIFLDAKNLQEMAVPILKELKELESQIHHLAGEVFNLNSPKQLGAILYEKMGIKPPRKGYSTSADVLMTLKNDHPIAEKVLLYRTLEKLRSTYIETLPHEINPETNRVHCTFNQFVTATGRLSCQDPNLQNIPVRTEAGRKIREAFRPEKSGWSYLSADYSQVELRLLAHFTEDPNLLEAFHHNQDIHAHTAATIFSLPPEEVTREMRTQAKAVNFGILYGQQAFGLSQELNIELSDASAFIEMYFKQFPKVLDFLESCKEKVRESGKAVTHTGRERAIPEITSKNYMIRMAAERLAVNTPIQGTAADIMKLAMIRINQTIQDAQLKSFMVLQIHDELIFEVPDEEIETLRPLVKDAMEGAISLKVPLTVDIAIGKNWKEC